MEPLRRKCWRLQDREVALDCYEPPAGGASREVAPVVLLRGYGLDADWAFYPYFARRLAEVRPVWVPVPPEPYSLLAELEQVEILAQAWSLGQTPDAPHSARGAIGIVGHAKGAALALLAAARGSVQGVVGLAALSTLQRGSPPNAHPELAAAPHRFHMERAVRALDVPVLLIHGEEDHVAPIAEAELLYHWLPKETGRLIMLEKTGHSFGADHPFTATTKELELAVEVSCEFFR